MSDEDFRYRQLEQQLLDGIEAGRFAVGHKLPSIRSLCTEHGLSKATVQHALQRLEARGLIEARPKSGYFVLRLLQSQAPRRVNFAIGEPQPATVSDLLLDIMRRGAAFDILPSPGGSELPVGIQQLHRSISRALRRQKANEHLYYDDPAGLPLLREVLTQHLNQRGCQLMPERLLITSGCQHALFLALMACCKTGDTVAVESPGFYGTLQLLEQLGLNVLEIPASPQSGLDLDAMEAAVAKWSIRACVLSPSFSAPAGALLPVDAGRRLLTLAQRYDFAVIEDDIYADTAFRQTPDPLLSEDTDGRVILCGSLSKSLSRDLRLGWMSGGRWHSQIERLKLVTQLASSRATQQGAADFIQDGGYAAHLKRRRYQLREQRDQLLAALGSWSGDLRVSLPEGGLTLWLELDDSIDTLEIYPRALQQGVIITPGPLFSASGRYRNCLRLSFAHDWNRERLGALKTLERCLHKMFSSGR